MAWWVHGAPGLSLSFHSLPCLALPRVPFAEVNPPEMLSQRTQLTLGLLCDAVLVSSRHDFESPCSPSVSCLCTQVSWMGVTLLCPENLGCDEVEELENQAMLPDLQRKYLTALADSRWLLQPVLGRARKDIFQVDIPKHLTHFGQDIDDQVNFELISWPEFPDTEH